MRSEGPETRDRGSGADGGVRPAHHTGEGFRNPWPNVEQQGLTGLLRWMVVERLTSRRPADPPASTFPRAQPAFPAPRAAPAQLTATWVGHATFLLQLGELNVLTDPMWGLRASPVPFAGPRRWVLPGVELDALPPIDVVLLSHDHYDHLDEPTARQIAARFPTAEWLVPLRLGAWLQRRGVRAVREFDWWREVPLIRSLPVGGERGTSAEGAPGSRSDPPRGGPPTGTLAEPSPAAAPDSRGRERGIAALGAAVPRPASRDVVLHVTCVPAQHFSGRSAVGRNNTLWCGWAVRAGERRVLFAGDTGHHPEFAAIGERCGPFDLALVPIGAYEPRWFMRPVHMNPEDAVQAYQELTRGQPPDRRTVLGAMHWGTFKLTDEPMDEPPRRMQAAWREAGIDESLLWVPRHGETRVVEAGRINSADAVR